MSQENVIKFGFASHPREKLANHSKATEMVDQ